MVKVVDEALAVAMADSGNPISEGVTIVDPVPT